MSPLRRANVPLLAFVVAAALALNQIRAVMDTWGKFILAHPGFADFGSYYLYARVGLHYGFNHLYDSAVQHQEWLRLGGANAIPWFLPIYPPPLAWLVAPFALLPYPIAFAAWTLLLLSLLILTWRLLVPTGTPLIRWTALAATLALFPVLFAIVLGQILVVVLAAVAVSWFLVQRHERPLPHPPPQAGEGVHAPHPPRQAGEGSGEILAGLVLSVLILKPQVAFLVPVALLLAGRWRTVATWAVASLTLGLISLATTGVAGLTWYVDHVLHAAGAQQEFDVQTQFTLQGLLGNGLGYRLGAVLVILLAMAAAFRHRQDAVHIPVAAAIVASMLVTPYLHDQDLAALLLAGGIALHAPLDRIQRALLAAGYAMLVVISAWGFGPAGMFLGPMLVVIEIAWLAVVWRRSGRLLLEAEPFAQVPLDRPA